MSRLLCWLLFLSTCFGNCNNSQDLEIYHKYSKSLTGYSKQCALLSLIHLDLVDVCFKSYIGFSPACAHCWTENVKCDHQNCFGICLHSILTNQPNNYVNGSLNSCLQCDEDICGKEFLACAKVNRRNSGIITDIYRPDHQILKN